MTTVVPPKVYELIKQVLDEDISNYSISVHEQNKKNEGMLGELCYVSLQHRKSGDILNFAVKQAPSDDLARKANPIRDAYTNEIQFYTKVWPYFQQVQKQIPPAKAFNKIVKCFGTTDEDHSEIIILDNIKLQDFVTYDKMKPFDREHIEYILKEYGKYHALSFVYRAFNPEEYSKESKELKDLYATYMEQDEIRNLIKLIHEVCLKSLQPGKDDEVIRKYEYYIKNGVRIYSNSNNYSGKFSVIVHGDCHSNNMMFKYDERKKLTDMRFLDFQLVKDGTPVSDLAYFLYSGGSKDIFDQLDHYLHIYHNSLSETVEEFGLNSEDIYPFKALKQDWKQHCQLGFTMALVLWNGKLKIQNETDSKDKKDCNETYNYDETEFKKLTRDLILHMYDNDFLIDC